MPRSRFGRFLLVGGIAAAANWGSRFLFSDYLSLSLAIAAAYGVGVVVAYTLSRAFVFERSGRGVGAELTRFGVVNLFSLLQVWIVTICLADYLLRWAGLEWRREAVAHAIGVASPAVTSYLAHSRFTFAARDAQSAPASGICEAPIASKSSRRLIVDMDGTLLRTDLLAECFAAALFARPFSAIAATRLLAQGRSAFKVRLAELASVDVTRLPYREALVAHLRTERQQQREIHLVTAGDAGLAAKVADHLKLFDSVHGSTADCNLKGKAKLKHLRKLFPDGFCYAGDSAADLHVWAAADGVLLSGASPKVARRAKGLNKPLEAEFDTGLPKLGAWLKAMRLHQWSKNLLVFVPLLLSNRLETVHYWLVCLAGYLILGVAASATYILNDLADIDADRRHRTKCHRPLASGDLPVAHALVGAPAMLLAALAAACALSLNFAVLLGVYVVVTLSYSLRVKRVPLLDVSFLAALYTLRPGIGTALSETSVSPWLLTFAAIFFFSMSLAKRHVEITTSQAPADQTLPGRGYRGSDAPLTLALGAASSVASVLVIVEYMMAEAFPSAVYRVPGALWAAPVLVAIWICRIWLLAHRGELDDDPVAFAVRDRISLILAGMLGLAFLLARLG